MPLEVGLWRVDEGSAVRVGTSGFPLESRLEDLIESDPAILGEPLLLIGRQVPTDYGKFIDSLAVTAEGALHVLELKRDRTLRDVVAQVLDYGSWVEGLSHSQVIDIFNERHDLAFEEAFAQRFGVSPPEELNQAHKLTVIASDVDPATERIVTYLNTGFAVPVNVVFFRYFSDSGREYLARTWLLDEASVASRPAKRLPDASREPWNGRDWNVSFGEFPDQRVWEDARRYGFISAGGGVFYSRTLRSLPVGARVFVYIPQAGYVGAGITTGGGLHVRRCGSRSGRPAAATGRTAARRRLSPHRSGRRGDRQVHCASRLDKHQDTGTRPPAERPVRKPEQRMQAEKPVHP